MPSKPHAKTPTKIQGHTCTKLGRVYLPCTYSKCKADDDGLGFYTIRKGLTRIMKKRVGSVQDAFNTPGLKHILNCTAYVTMSMIVNTPCGTGASKAPDPAGGLKAKVRLCVVGVDAFGVSKGITAVQFSRGKKDRFMK
jgi:hypothetical protein